MPEYHEMAQRQRATNVTAYHVFSMENSKLRKSTLFGMFFRGDYYFFYHKFVVTDALVCMCTLAVHFLAISHETKSIRNQNEQKEEWKKTSWILMCDLLYDQQTAMQSAAQIMTWTLQITFI